MSPCYFVQYLLLAGCYCLLHVVVRFYFLLSSLRVLFFDLPPQEFCGPSKLFYPSSTKNIIILLATPAEEENLSCGREKRSFLPQHFVKYINSRDGTSWKILNLNSKMFGELICQKWSRFLFESYTDVPICLLKVINWEMWLKKILSNVLEAQSYYYSFLMVVVKQVFT